MHYLICALGLLAMSVSIANAQAGPAELNRLSSEARAAMTANNPDLALQLGQQALKLVEGPPVSESAAATEALRALAYIRIQLRQTEMADPLVARALSMDQKRLGAEHPDVARDLNAVAELELARDRFQQAEQALKRALDLRERAQLGNDAIAADTQALLGRTYFAQDSFREAEPFFKRALSIRETLFGKESAELVPLLRDLAFIAATERANKEAEERYQRAIAIMEKAYGIDNIALAPYVQAFGTFYFASAQYKEAEPVALRDMQIQEKAFGPDNLKLILPLNRIARNYRAWKKFELARPYLERALAIAEKNSAPGDIRTIEQVDNLARMYLEWAVTPGTKRGASENALSEQMALRSLAIREKALPPNHPDLIVSLEQVSKDYQAGRQYAKALQYRLRELALREATDSPESESVANCHGNLAFLFYLDGQFDKAEQHYQRGAAIMEKLPEKRLEMAIFLNNLGMIYLEQKKYSQSELNYCRALNIQSKLLPEYHAVSLNTVSNILTLREKSGASKSGVFSTNAYANLMVSIRRNERILLGNPEILDILKRTIDSCWFNFPRE